MEDIEYKRLQKSSYISAVLTLMGFVIILSSLVFSYFQIKEKELMVNELTKIEEELASKIKSQERRIKELEWASSPKAIVAQTKAVKLHGVTDPEGRQIYDFSIWLQIPVLLKDKITKVEYFFHHPSMLKKMRESTEVSNGYSVSYRGWGCLTAIDIKVHLNDGEIYGLVFNQCTGEQVEKKISTP